jgi:ammonium transporter, Amt family
MNAGDTTWIMVCAVLVFIMTPGVALFYGGLARRKNVLSILMQCFVIMCLVTIQWVLAGYSLAFGPDTGWGVIGGLQWAGLRGVGMEPHDYAGTVPHYVFMIFQLQFAIITAAIMVGAFAERMKFSAFLALILLWTTFVYDPIAHWVWGNGGWLGQMGALDFAGGIVVHVSSGVSALLIAVMIGRRVGLDKTAFAPHNLSFTVLGGALLWFGWFGFNAGSALAADGVAANAFVTTMIAAAASGLIWMFIEWKHHGVPTILGVVTGAIGGLVAITPACGLVTPMAAIPVGLCSGALCYWAITILKPRLGYDDSLDVFGLHGMAGIWGTVAVGLFAVESLAGTNGFFYGGAQLLPIQLIYMAVCIVYALAATWIIVKVVDSVIGIRVSREDEIVGLDLTQHQEGAYTTLE